MSAYNSEKDLADMYVTSKASLSTSAEIATESQEKKDTEFACQFLEEEVVARRLAQVKMEAEFERRLKERMDAEFEAKVEAKARELFSRVEEQRQLTELQEKLRNYNGHFIETQFKSSTLEYLKKTSQIPLYYYQTYHNYDTGDTGYSREVRIVITNKNILGLFPQINSERTSNWSTETICLLYSFTSPLNLKQLHMFLNVAKYAPASIKYGNSLSIHTPKRIESIIRTIPGKYSNGHWKQLDGFFGVYLNEDTLEVCAVPPSIDM